MIPKSLNFRKPKNLAPFDSITSLQLSLSDVPEHILFKTADEPPNSCCRINAQVVKPSIESTKWIEIFIF